MVKKSVETLSDPVCIATLKKPYGIKGWLWVFSHTQNRADIFAMSPWYRKTATGFLPLTVKQWRVQGSGLVASFAEVADRNVAETLYGVGVWTEKSAFPALAEDEYYWADLIGLCVVNTQDQILGRVADMFETAAHAIMEVEPTKDSVDNEKRLIPWHAQTVQDVQLGKKIVVDWQTDY